MVYRARTPQVMESAVYYSERRYTRDDWVDEFCEPATIVKPNGANKRSSKSTGRRSLQKIILPAATPPKAPKPIDCLAIGDDCPTLD